jgi:hypothetical protein
MSQFPHGGQGQMQIWELATEKTNATDLNLELVNQIVLIASFI